MTEDLGTLLTRRGAEHRLWCELPVRAFVRLDETHAFARDHRLVVVKRRELIRDVPVTQTPLGVVAFCRLDLIACGGVPVAYAVTSARCHLRVRERYCSWSIRGESALAGSPLYADGTLGIVGDERALVAFLHHRHWTVQA